VEENIPNPADIDRDMERCRIGGPTHRRSTAEGARTSTKHQHKKGTDPIRISP
jgi:hypothetical protein